MNITKVPIGNWIELVINAWVYPNNRYFKEYTIRMRVLDGAAFKKYRES